MCSCILKTIIDLSFFSAQKEELKSCEDRVKKLLEITPPKGKEFLRAVEHILEREKNWVCVLLLLSLFTFWLEGKWSLMVSLIQVWWKRDGCPPFEKQPIENKSAIAGQKRRYEKHLNRLPLVPCSYLGGSVSHQKIRFTLGARQGRDF